MVSRRRTRTRRPAPQWSDSSEEGDEDANAQVPKAPTSKVKGKQKAVVKSSAARNTKRGKLGLISEMPLDVLYEVDPSCPHFHRESDLAYVLCPQIFSFLTPRDLVRMSWTNKEFRRELTSHSTRNIWKAALESVDGLPPCPAHMNEIEYSTVLFHNACHVGLLTLISNSMSVHDGTGVWKRASPS